MVRACVSLDYLLEREFGFRAFCDHSNLIQIFSPSEEVKEHTRGKLLCWALRISCLWYTIEHVDGEKNVWEDIVSRWKTPAAGSTGSVQVRTARLADDAGLSRLRPLQDVRFEWPSLENIRVAQE